MKKESERREKEQNKYQGSLVQRSEWCEVKADVASERYQIQTHKLAVYTGVYRRVSRILSPLNSA